MGHREVKRVSLKFNWPLNVVWEGYLNPYPGPKDCRRCDGTGYNSETKQLADDFYDLEGSPGRWKYNYGFAPDGTPVDRPPWQIMGECRKWNDEITQDEVEALVDRGRLYDFTHIPTNKGWKKRAPPYIPTADEVNAWERIGGLRGHDAINRMILIETRAKRLGIYGHCDKCGGEGEIPNPDPEIRRKYNRWRPKEPPDGKGWQLWETVSEGNPISPVLRTPEELATYCAENSTIFADEKLSREQWYKMIVGKGMDVTEGSMLIKDESKDYVGSLANAPKRRKR